MLKTRLVVLSSLALLAMLVGLVACGGGTSGLIDADLSADDAYMGITGGDFKVVRSNDAGYRDSALNRTLDLQSVSRGDVTVVTISVNDTDPMYGVTLELNYDPSRYNPQSVEFMGLVDTPIELATMKVNGLVAAGQVDVNGQAVRSGEFVTVTFANEPSRVNKATSAVHDAFALDHLYEPGTMETAGGGIAGWTYTEPAAAGDPGTYTLHATWAVGDGNSDGGTTVSDITPIISHGYYEVSNVVDDDFAPATADYNGDGRVTVADITPIGQNYEAFYSEIHIAIGDDADFADATPLVVLDQADGAAPVIPVPAPMTDWDGIFRNWSGEIADADITANSAIDGRYWLAARLSDGTDPGDWTVFGPYAGGPPPPPNFIIGTFWAEVAGATGGTGSEGAEHFVDGDTVLAPANSDLTVDVIGIEGTYEGIPFVGDDGTAPTDEYEAALAAAKALVSWTPTAATMPPDMWATSEVLALTDSTIAVFPDEDEEDDPEGALEVTMAASGTFVPGPLIYNFDVDVAPDPLAPEVMQIQSSAGADGTDWLIDLGGNTDLVYMFNFGTDGVPDPLSSVGAVLYDLTDNAEAITFTYTADPPGVNEFQIIDNAGPESSHVILAKLGGGNAVAGHFYTLRIMDGVHNSVNKPSSWLVLAEPPPPVTFQVIPVGAEFMPDNDHLWVFYPDPRLRRNCRASYNLATDEIQPEDQEAYDDIIKQGDGEFFYENAGGTLHPKIVVVQDTDPSSIGYGDASEPGVVKAYTCPGYLVVDVAVLTTVGGPGDPDEDYGFAVFSAGQIPLGGGTFVVHPEVMAPQAPTGIDWGINIFDGMERGDLDLSMRDFTNHELDADTVGGALPDVLYVEFGGGDVGHWAEPQSGAPNIWIRLHSETEGDWDLMWDPRVVLGTAGAMIAVHGFEPFDFQHPVNPTQGNLDPGFFYDIQLVDPTGTILYETLSGQMIVVGTNPNEE